MIYLKKLGDPEWSLVTIFAEKFKVYKDTVFDAKVIKVIGVDIACYLGSPRPIGYYSYVFILS